MYTVDSGCGIFLTIKGSVLISSHIEEYFSAGKDAMDAILAALGNSVPQQDLPLEIQPLWQVVAQLKPFMELTARDKPHFCLCDRLLYCIT